MREVLQVGTALIGSLGFAMLFHIKGGKLLFIGFGGALSWTVFLCANSLLHDIFFSLLIASVAVTTLSEVLARLLKAPVILLLVPMIIPLIPGGDLYYTMSHLVYGDFDKFGQTSALVVKEALAIAFKETLDW